MANNYYIEEFQDYLERLCEEHVDVAHNVDGRRSFSRLFTDDEVAAIADSAGKNVVIVARYYGRSIGTADDQRMLQTITIYFASYASGSTAQAINCATSLSFNIMLDFLARFHSDLQAAGYCDALTDLELQNISWDEIPDQPFLDNHFGWELTLPFKSFLPGYNEDKWINRNG